MARGGGGVFCAAGIGDCVDGSGVEEWGVSWCERDDF